MNCFLKIAAISAAAISSPLMAESVEQKHIDKGKFVFDSESGYIFLHGPTRTVGRFLKVPDAEDIEEYQAEWEEALAKAQEKYARKLKSWERRVATANKTGEKKPEKPVEPTRENFSIGALETRNAVSFGPQYIFAKAAKGEPQNFSYMEKVDPGTYIYYGPIVFNANTGTMGTCFCMGSVQFEVKPGTITNLGNFLIAAPDHSAQPAFATASDLTVPNAFFSTRVSTSPTGIEISYSLPDSLQDFPNEKADFRAAGKMDNYYGISISRMAPVPGILAYNRDQVVDLKAKPEPMVTVVEPSEAEKAESDQKSEMIEEPVEAETDQTNLTTAMH